MTSDENYILTGNAVERYFDLHKALLEFSSLFDYSEPNERSIAIVGATYLEMILDHILLAFFPEDDKEVLRLLDYNGPLGNFSNKISMCYCLGLIDKTIRDDLTLVRKIRNKFAHEMVIRFTDEPMQSWCRDLKWHKISLTPFPPKDATSRDLFQVGVHQLISHLNGCVGTARNQKRTLLNNFT
ncbi:MltR family transcriptional regulator [Flavobacterium sp. UBA7682]|uniref:MltR family transcriptional regulator n=1 Tax=Flavobacterium sp. UBA7682 TaxID=1946560 RepID=UPI0025C722E4|nr:MltR family transcriptional regulator [Flavobacterium sp. UBA7682]